ncbi:ATP-binding protein [Ramlibacter sp. Leaf400]|uniref:ATP-binding protein n=1 Tax=Ramlibacter sp. Leaf400 TaxID=1736365 RepID=UPI0007002DFE|nr:ATP-binding protein [Ramlibacter sp. Leaf400]KQT13492.1 hypothetical protein ASG30_18870 [Ramlibacter sp. Leaf400]
MPSDPVHPDVAAIGSIEAVPHILQVVTLSTGMGFAAVARVTDRQWICCAARDNIGFGLVPGGELELLTTLCHEIRQCGDAVVIDDVREDPLYRDHHTPAKYGFRSYISMPIRRRDGSFFGTLCAIDPAPARLKNEATIGMFRLFAEMIGAQLDAQDRTADLARVREESDRRKRIYETILANTPDLAYVFDLDHRFVYANEVLLRMWGRTWDDAIGKTCLELGYEPWHAEMHDREIEHVKATRESVRGQVPFEGAFGRRIYDYIFVPVIGADGTVEAVAGTTRDVTDFKLYEERLGEHLEREQLRASVMTRVASASRRMNAMLSVDSVATLLTEEARQVIGTHAAVASIAAAGEGAPAVTTASLSDKYADRRDAGTVPHLPAGLALPLMGSGGETLGTVRLSDKYEGGFTEADEAVLAQLAAVAAASIETAQLYERLREQDRRKDEFLAVLAHELRNPLAPLRTGLSLLNRRPAQAMADRTMQIMERQLAHMVRLVDDLMDLARITTGKVQLRLERMDLRAAAEAAVESCRPAVEAAGQELAFALPPEPVWVRGDPVRLSQVVGNLLGNASKYTPAGGRIALELRTQGAAAQLTVTDTGAGIAPDILPRIFEMFVQEDRSRTQSQGGLGIGLALVRQLAERHDGAVSAASRGAGHGSTFTLTLPLLAQGIVAGAAVAPRDRVAAGARRAPLRVLVVDDNPDAVDTLSGLLKTLGHEVRSALSGEDALPLAGEFRPHCVLLDIGLPGMSGYDVARRLRAADDPQVATCKLVALTGWGAAADRRRAAHAGFDLHLTKPVDVVQLEEVLGQLEAPADSPAAAAQLHQA